MHFHLIGICGTGMGSLAGLLVEAGHRVSGSDTGFNPPIGPLLQQLGVQTYQGWSADHLAGPPDVVVVGNVCRRDNIEAAAAVERGLKVVSMPQLLEEQFLAERQNLVVAGTHGKTTTTSLVSFLLDACGRNPGFFVGGVPANFGISARRGDAAGPFVIEGDEYDSAFFEKTPKFWRYRPAAAVLTSAEYDHVDIYPDEAAYLSAFEHFVTLLPENGLLIAWAGDPNVRAIAKHACAPVHFYALADDQCGEATPFWTAAPVGEEAAAGQSFDLFGGGSYCGRVALPLSGKHNLRNALAALAIASEAGSCRLDELITALPRFAGVQRRQELVGSVSDIHVYDDFAHHPTAVRETLAGLRRRHPNGRLIAAFQPRSATACRALHQDAYPAAFEAASLTLLAPVARDNVPKEDRLDTAHLAQAITEGGGDAQACMSVDALIDAAVRVAKPGDTIVTLSNGTFDGAPDRILAELTSLALQQARATF